MLDQDGAPVPIGAVGRVFVGNDMLFDGYTNAASPAIEDQLMDTGDLGYLDASGRLFVAGRDDEMIISGGENVFPRPVEEAIARLPQVAEVAVVGVPDPEFGQRLAAFVVCTAGASLDERNMRSSFEAMTMSPGFIAASRSAPAGRSLNWVPPETPASV